LTTGKYHDIALATVCEAGGFTSFDVARHVRYHMVNVYGGASSLILRSARSVLPREKYRYSWKLHHFKCKSSIGGEMYISS